MPKISPFKFLQEVRAEAAKVTWPTRKETAVTTALVFAMVVAAAIFFFAVDQLLGYGVRRRPAVVLMLFPLVVSVAIFLIAEIDTPGNGMIRVLPHNLISLSQSLDAQ